DVPQELLEKKAGVFVSLKKDGRLRGCIGTIAPTTGSVAEEIIQNAVSAAVSDRRFPEVAYEELPYLEYSSRRYVISVRSTLRGPWLRNFRSTWFGATASVFNALAIRL